ncbi:hypothetical protein LINPERPRIM_LOCUS6262 [Linum perenne]
MGNCIQKKIHDRSQKILGPDVFIDAGEKRELKAMTYNPEVSRKMFSSGSKYANLVTLLVQVSCSGNLLHLFVIN